MKQKSIHVVGKFLQYWQQYWLLRWVLVNFLAWGIGLLSASIIIWLFGLIGLFFSGAIIGLAIGIAQSCLLFTTEETSLRRKWSLYTAIGAFFGMFPAGVLALLSIFNIWIAAILVGAFFSGLIALTQSFILVSLLDDTAYLWIPMSILAGGIAALITVPILLSPIPMLFSPASTVFALMTGWLLQTWLFNET